VAFFWPNRPGSTRLFPPPKKMFSRGPGAQDRSGPRPVDFRRLADCPLFSLPKRSKTLVCCLSTPHADVPRKCDYSPDDDLRSIGSFHLRPGATGSALKKPPPTEQIWDLPLLTPFFFSKEESGVQLAQPEADKGFPFFFREGNRVLFSGTLISLLFLFG